jgi:hypothetical protein
VPACSSTEQAHRALQDPPQQRLQRELPRQVFDGAGQRVDLFVRIHRCALDAVVGVHSSRVGLRSGRRVNTVFRDIEHEE